MIVAQGKGESASRRPGLIAHIIIFIFPPPVWKEQRPGSPQRIVRPLCMISHRSVRTLRLCSEKKLMDCYSLPLRRVEASEHTVGENKGTFPNLGCKTSLPVKPSFAVGRCAYGFRFAEMLLN